MHVHTYVVSIHNTDICTCVHATYMLVNVRMYYVDTEEIQIVPIVHTQMYSMCTYIHIEFIEYTYRYIQYMCAISLCYTIGLPNLTIWDVQRLHPLIPTTLPCSVSSCVSGGGPGQLPASGGRDGDKVLCCGR